MELQMKQKNRVAHPKHGQFMTAAILLLLADLCTAQAQTTTTQIAIGTTVLQPTVKHLGINLGMHNFWDSGQMMQNLVLENPGFEGEIYQSIIECASGSVTTCVDSDLYSAWPAGFWNGATFEFFYGAANGLTGTVSNYTAATSSQGGVLNFSTPLGVAPKAGDFVIVRQTVPGNAAAGWWTTTSGKGAITTNQTDLPPGTTGSQTIALTAPTAADSAVLDSYFDSTSGRSFIQLDGTFQVSFLAKGTGGSKSVAVSVSRQGVKTYLSQTVSLSSSWQTYTLTFSASETGSAVGTVDLKFATVGQDYFYLDDVSLQASSPSNPTAFRDAVVATLTALNPGSLRFWSGNQLGDTLDNLIAGPFSRMRSGYSAYSTSATSIEYGLHDFLQLCQTIGAEPWFVVPSTFTTTEAANLIEYLGSASTTTYGAKRAAQGQVEPWTSVLPKIHLEFGNEAWNSTFRGGSIESSAAYGARAQTIFAAMRADPAYSASSFDLVLGGQAGNPWLNQQIQNNTNNNDSFAIAPYMMNEVNTFATNEDLFAPLLAEPQAFYSPSGHAEGVNSTYLTIDGVGRSVNGGMVYLDQLAIQNSTHPVPVVIYESNLSTLSGAITQSVINEFTPSIGAGLAEIENMLLGMSHGIITQNLWQLPQWNFAISTAGGATRVPLWGAVIDMGGPTNLRRPQYLAIQLANQTIPSGGSMLQTVQSGANPTWNQALVNSVQLSGAQYIESFAFLKGSQSAFILLNLNMTSALPVTFSGANAPTGTVQLTQLTSANLTDTNENSEVVVPVSSSQTFTAATTLSLPPFSMTALTWGTQTVPTDTPVISNVQATAISTSGVTITWTTSTAASSEVVYGTTASYGLSTTTVSTLVTSHSVTLNGLAAGTTYDFAVVSATSGGPSVTSANYSFTTLASGAPTGPAPPQPSGPLVISNVQVTDVRRFHATITWTTSAPSSSQIVYGTTTTYGLSAWGAATLVTSHSVTLNGLAAGTTYDFAVVSALSGGPSVTSVNYSFTTRFTEQVSSLASASPAVVATDARRTIPLPDLLICEMPAHLAMTPWRRFPQVAGLSNRV
jgi:Fibronectin type III domain